ncbi:hypothetical protein PLESTM_002080200 [Pleodorina starrii]|nr:hypothetical protein PLESTM_002080200 [Pleodorina starrii]
MVKRWGCNHALVEITRLVKVVTYLKHKDAGGQPPSPDSAAKVGHCGRLVGWLHNIQRQLRRDYPTAPPQAPQPAAGEGGSGSGGGGGAGEDEGDADDNGLPSMSEVLSFVVTLRCRADRVLARDLGALGSGPVSYEAAVLQMHALLTEFLSGVYMPPMRMSSLCTLMVPGQDTCQEQDCGRQGCRGNNLMDAREPSLADRPPPSGPASSSKQPQPSSTDPASISSGSGRRLVVEITHHKTERFSRNQPPLRLVLPAELSSSVRQYVQYARPVLMRRAAREDHDAPPYLLISRNGAPFAGSPVQFAVEWQWMQAAYGPPWRRFPPQKFRHIYATGAVQGLVQEVEDRRAKLQADAKAMGNSLRVWDTHYVQRQDDILGQAAIRRLQAWRDAELQRQGLRAGSSMEQSAAARTHPGSSAAGAGAEAAAMAGGDGAPSAPPAPVPSWLGRQPASAHTPPPPPPAASGVGAGTRGGGDEGTRAGAGPASVAGAGPQPVRTSPPGGWMGAHRHGGGESDGARRHRRHSSIGLLGSSSSSEGEGEGLEPLPPPPPPPPPPPSPPPPKRQRTMAGSWQDSTLPQWGLGGGHTIGARSGYLAGADGFGAGPAVGALSRMNGRQDGSGAVEMTRQLQRQGLRAGSGMEQSAAARPRPGSTAGAGAEAAAMAGGDGAPSAPPAPVHRWLGRQPASARTTPPPAASGAGAGTRGGGDEGTRAGAGAGAGPQPVRTSPPGGWMGAHRHGGGESDGARRHRRHSSIGPLGSSSSSSDGEGEGEGYLAGAVGALSRRNGRQDGSGAAEVARPVGGGNTAREEGGGQGEMEMRGARDELSWDWETDSGAGEEEGGWEQGQEAEVEEAEAEMWGWDDGGVEERVKWEGRVGAWEEEDEAE